MPEISLSTARRGRFHFEIASRIYSPHLRSYTLTDVLPVRKSLSGCNRLSQFILYTRTVLSSLCSELRWRHSACSVPTSRETRPPRFATIGARRPGSKCTRDTIYISQDLTSYSFTDGSSLSVFCPGLCTPGRSSTTRVTWPLVPWTQLNSHLQGFTTTPRLEYRERKQRG